jgi:hypothetical protein
MQSDCSLRKFHYAHQKYRDLTVSTVGGTCNYHRVAYHHADGSCFEEFSLLPFALRFDGADKERGGGGGVWPCVCADCVHANLIENPEGI